MDAKTVGAVATLTGVSVRTLHHYDHIGLVVPSVRTSAGYRGYTDADIERLHLVLVYRSVGLPLDEIRTLLDDVDADVVAHLQRQHALLTEQAERLQRHHQSRGGTDERAPQRHPAVGGGTGRDLRHAPPSARSTPKRPRSDGATPTRGSSRSSGPPVSPATTGCGSSLTAMRCWMRWPRPSAAACGPERRRANELAARHRASIERFYDCGDEMHRCVAEMYLADERFTRYYDDVEPGLAQFLHDIVVESLSLLDSFAVSLRPMAGHPPSGTVTFLLTDLEGSTRLWEQDPDGDEGRHGPPRRDPREDDRGPSGARLCAHGRWDGGGIRNCAGRRGRGGGIPAGACGRAMAHRAAVASHGSVYTPTRP